MERMLKQSVCIGHILPSSDCPRAISVCPQLLLSIIINLLAAIFPTLNNVYTITKLKFSLIIRTSTPKGRLPYLEDIL